MKRTLEILMTLPIIMATAFVGSALTGCSDDDIDYALVYGNTTPEFTYQDFDAISYDFEETTNGTWKIRRLMVSSAILSSVPKALTQPPRQHLLRRQRISSASSCL